MNDAKAFYKRFSDSHLKERVEFLEQNCTAQHANDRYPDYDNEVTGWVLPYTEWSHYAMDPVYIANCRFWEQSEVAHFLSISGTGVDDHGGEVVLPSENVRAIPKDKWEEFVELVEGSQNYCIYDEHIESEVRSDMENHWWEQDGKKDLENAIEKVFEVDIEEMEEKDPEFRKQFDAWLESEDLAGMFWETIANGTGEEFSYDNGAYCNVEGLIDENWDFKSILRSMKHPDSFTDEETDKHIGQLRLPLQFAESLASLLLEGYSYSSTQINLPQEMADQIMAWGRANIHDTDLYVDADGDCGREDEIHVTVKFGLVADRPSKELLDIISKTEEFEIRLQPVSLFRNDEFDVVKLGVVSPGLRELNRRVSSSCENEDKYPDYQPHVTIAYVKKGRGDRLEGQSPWDGYQKMGVTNIGQKGVFTASEFQFSSKNDDIGKRDFTLQKPKEKAVESLRDRALRGVEDSWRHDKPFKAAMQQAMDAWGDVVDSLSGPREADEQAMAIAGEIQDSYGFDEDSRQMEEIRTVLFKWAGEAFPGDW